VNAHPSLHCKPNPDNPKFAVAQDAGNYDPQPGMLRILGCWGDRAEQIPEGKKHELWLPMPGSDVPTLDLDEAVLAQFHELADERTAETEEKSPPLPFHPAGTQRNDDPGKWGNRFRVKAGDLVYFDLDDNSKVREIALSAIWRGMVKDKAGKGAGASQFFQAVDTDLVPFSRDRKEKTKTITIAERMFGFVEENKCKDDKSASDGGLALASRIRFSDGLLKDGVTAADALEPAAVTLRILSSPKPPSPALYFKARTGGRYIKKVDLKPGEHHPQGRKMYLHHTVQPGAKPWETRHLNDNIDQKNRVRPVRRGQLFTFQLDFDNLTDRELGLLLYSLTPGAGFHHKLGMGKPLGLGSVKIDVLEWKAVDREARYTVVGLRSNRYVKIRRPDEAGFWSLRDEAVSTGLVSREIHAALSALGDFAEAPTAESIHTPTLADQMDPEAETYKWFVANDRTQDNFLKTIAENGGAIPALPRPEWRPAPPPGRRR
jgi:CRISPR-associated protein (TIGR03986 family)